MADRLDKLRDLADLLWTSLTEAPADKGGPLAAQYRATLADIAELEREAGKVADPIDEITARRSARGGSTARTRSTQGSSG